VAFTQDRTEALSVLTKDNTGHVFAGASLPFGMAKAVADSVNDNAGGYASDGEYSKNAALFKLLLLRLKNWCQAWG
jgi:putative alpha-1,2-mannosidase